MRQLRIRISLVARFGTMVETTVASPYVSALLRFAPHLVGNGFIRSACYGFVGTFRSGNRKNRIGISADAPLKNRLRQMRCNYIRAVGATFFQRRIHIVPMRLLRYPGAEVTDETGKLPPYISAVLNSALHP